MIKMLVLGHLVSSSTILLSGVISLRDADDSLKFDSLSLGEHGVSFNIFPVCLRMSLSYVQGKHLCLG